MVRRAPERNRQTEPVEGGQQAIEQGAIFHGELAREPAFRGVVEIEPCLHGRKIWRADAEGLQSLAELAALWPVLRVVDHDIFAADERQRVVQRLRLGARVKLGHDDDFNIAGQAERARRGDRGTVRSFQNDLDVELGRRVVEAREGPD
jgi:hypothetical protein